MTAKNMQHNPQSTDPLLLSVLDYIHSPEVWKNAEIVFPLSANYPFKRDWSAIYPSEFCHFLIFVILDFVTNI